MNIKERIDGLSEAVAKAALQHFLELFASMQKTKSEYMAGFQNVHPVEYYEMECLDKFLDMTREETKTEAEKRRRGNERY